MIQLLKINNNILDMPKIKIINEYFEINSEEDLIALLININKHGGEQKSLIIWNLIMELDEQLINLIKTNNGLINILKELDQKRAILLLNILSDKLGIIVENSNNLSEILARFSSGKGYKTQIIRNLRSRGLKYIIRNANDFITVVEWLYGDAENELFKLLEGDYIKSLFSNIEEIGKVFYYLNDNNKELFVKIIGIENIANKIFTYKNLESCKSFRADDFQKLISYLGNDKILDLFYSEKDFYEFLLSLPQSKEKVFLDFLNKNKNEQ